MTKASCQILRLPSFKVSIHLFRVLSLISSPQRSMTEANPAILLADISMSWSMARATMRLTVIWIKGDDACPLAMEQVKHNRRGYIYTRKGMAPNEIFILRKTSIFVPIGFHFRF